MADRFQIVAAGDAALLVQFDERIDAAINADAIGLGQAIRLANLPGLRDVVPTFRTVAVYFDPLRVAHDHLIETVRNLASRSSERAVLERPLIRVPVRYGGEFGPDLGDVARFANLDEHEVIAKHVAVTYRVFMLGFVPGFAYMGSVDPLIAAPRRTAPRTRVPAGSVGIAGEQTGIYPMEVPGGWQVIGRTEIRTFDPDRTPSCLFEAGDTVQFYRAEQP